MKGEEVLGGKTCQLELAFFCINVFIVVSRILKVNRKKSRLDVVRSFSIVRVWVCFDWFSNNSVSSSSILLRSQSVYTLTDN